jgi:hypothetical protein
MKRKKSDLNDVFQQYNRKYFSGKLKVSDVQFGNSRCLGETAFFDNCPPIIVIDRKMMNYGRIVRMILLHEMAHVSMPNAVGVGHGPKFVRRMRRLVSQGAFDDLL